MVLVSKSTPGVTREQRISNEGLVRLEMHLRAGTKINAQVLPQWVKRHGEDAGVLLKQLEYEVKN